MRILCTFWLKRCKLLCSCVGSLSRIKFEICVTKRSRVMAHISTFEITCTSELQISNDNAKHFQRQTFPLGRATSPPLVSPGFLSNEVYFGDLYLRQILKSITGSFVHKADRTTLRINLWQVCDMLVYIGTALRLCNVDIQSTFRLTIGKILKIKGRLVQIRKSSFVLSTSLVRKILFRELFREFNSIYKV